MAKTRRDALQLLVPVAALAAVAATVRRGEPDAGLGAKRAPIRESLRGTNTQKGLANTLATGTADDPGLPAPDALTLLTGRCSYGLTQAEYQEAMALGYDGWLEAQLDYMNIDDSALANEVATAYPRSGWSMQQLVSESRQLGNGGSLAAADHIRFTLLRKLKSRRQLFEVMVEFWTDHLNIHNGSFPISVYKLIDDRDVIRANALGNFGTMLRASARSPAMLVYLENFNNVAGTAQENYARELMELHAMGVGGGYTEADVKDVARCFTGWTVKNAGTDNPQFTFLSSKHDTGAKLVLGNVVPAGRGIEDGDQVLDILLQHPSTARHIASKLCAHFIGDDPETAAVDAVAAAFTASAGDIPTMLRTLFSTPGFLASRDRKVRRPVSVVAASLRVAGAAFSAVVSGGNDYMRTLNSRLTLLGNLPYRWLPPDGYPDYNGYWVNSGASLNRWNWMFAVAEGKANAGIVIDAFALAGGATNPTQLVDNLAQRLLRRSLSTPDRDRFIAFAANGGSATATLTTNNVTLRSKEMIGLLLSSAYFQYR